MFRPFVLVALPLALTAVAACQQEQEAPVVPPTTTQAPELPEDLIMPPEEAEAPPALGQEGLPMPETPPVLPAEDGAGTGPVQSPPPQG